MPERLTIAVFNESTRWALPQIHADQIAEAAGEGIEVVRVANRAEMTAALAETDYLIGMPPNEEQMLLLKGRLKWLQLTASIGDYDTALIPAVEAGVRITSAASIRAPQVAEHALALVLALTRRLDAAFQAQEQQRWSPEKITGRITDLRGSTAGIVAEGTIGQEIAQRLKSFGLHVLATRRDPENPYMFVDEVFPPENLGELVARSDIIVVAAPRTPATIGLIGRTVIGQMKAGALLVDVSRGGVVHQGSIVAALRKQRIAGAALDAFETEPLPPNSPLWSIPNVIITPHVAAASPRYWQTATEVICRNITRLREGRPLIDEISPEWYPSPAKR